MAIDHQEVSQTPVIRADVLQSPNAERWAGRPAGPWLNRRPPLTGGCSREKVSAPPRPPSPSPSKTRGRAVLRAH